MLEITETNHGQTSGITIEVDGDRVIINGAAFVAPTAAKALAEVDDRVRFLRTEFYLEQGAITSGSSELNATFGSVERVVRGLTDHVDKVVGCDLPKQLAALMGAQDANLKLTLSKAADPAHKDSIPGSTLSAVAQANQAHLAEVKRVMGTTEDGPLAVLLKAIKDARQDVLTQLAVKRALSTKSIHGGNDFQTGVGEFLAAWARTPGHVVERTTDTTGQAGGKGGDYVVDLNAAACGGVKDVRIAVEAKTRNTGKRFTVKEIRDELAAAQQNRNARGVVFLVPKPEMLPGDEPFVDVGPGMIAAMLDLETGDTLAATLALRIAIAEAIGTQRPRGEDGINREAVEREVASLRRALRTIEQFRKEQRSAVTQINNATNTAEGFFAAVMESAARLEALLTTD